MADKKITDLTLRSNVNDDVNFPVDDGIQTYRVTGPQIKAYVKPVYIAPWVQNFITGSGTYKKGYVFLVVGANATVGATYTNNGVTYTVLKTISSGGILRANGIGDPAVSGTLTKATGTGDATIAFSEFKSPVYLRVRAVGAGGGGGGGGALVTSGPTDGTGTTFGTSLITGSGGKAGATGGDQGGAGGGATIGTGAIGLSVPGGSGSGPAQNLASVPTIGGAGGCSSLGGGGGAGYNGSGASSGATNSGGGGGGSGSGSGSNIGGSGGGAGGFVDAIIESPSSTYSYSIGTGGTGDAGSNGTGGNGADGQVNVEECFQ